MHDASPVYFWRHTRVQKKLVTQHAILRVGHNVTGYIAQKKKRNPIETSLRSLVV